jgi:serine/threonine-protein kinase
MDTEQRNDPWVGRALGEYDRYRITRSLNAGGMGYVYLAIDTKLNNQQVAIKVLRDSLAGMGEMHERFKREVDLCAALNSPNVVRINDRGTTAEGYPFYVMEYLQGRSLGQLLKEKLRLPVKEALEITLQVCDGLEIAHAGVMVDNELCHIVHRDLKPDNIFLQPLGKSWLAKILDFGIAKKLRDNATEKNSSATSFFLGTWRYSAPEQIEVHPQVDQRADIYSLGMIIYQMLTGVDPFGLWNTDDGNSALTTWWRAHTTQPPEPLRRQPGCNDMPPALEAVVLKCLAKFPADRYASVAELKQALEPILETAVAQNPNSSENTVLGVNSGIDPHEANSGPLTAQTMASPLSHNQAGQHPAKPATPAPVVERPTPAVVTIDPPKARSGLGWRWLLPIGLVLGLAGLGWQWLTASQRQLDHLSALKNTAEFDQCIQESQAVQPDSQIYLKAQEILNRCRLSQAILLEQQSKVQEALAIARQIPSTSPIYPEAQQYIKLWEQI